MGKNGKEEPKQATLEINAGAGQKEASAPPGQAALVERPKAPIEIGDRGIELRTFDDLMRFAKCVAASELVPKDFQNVISPDGRIVRDHTANVMIAIQYGLELGLSPIQALQNIAVINGRPCMWGDALLAMVRSTGQLEYFEEHFEGEWAGDKTADDFAAVCQIRRKGGELRIERFSVGDAKRAKLWNKEGPWTFYPRRMLQMRARGYNVRDTFADRIKGIRPAEEVVDIPPESYTVVESEKWQTPKALSESAQSAAPEPEKKEVKA